VILPPCGSDIAPCGRSDILFAPRVRRTRSACRQYHSAKPNITAPQYNLPKANKVEKDEFVIDKFVFFWWR
jgi:hypothetical protein